MSGISKKIKAVLIIKLMSLYMTDCHGHVNKVCHLGVGFGKELTPLKISPLQHIY